MEKKNSVSMIFVIAERGLGDEITEYFANFYSGFATMLGKGTAKQHWLNLIGIGDTDKDVVAFPAQGQYVGEIFEELKTNFKIGAGKGVAFSVRVSSIADRRVLENI